MMSSILIVEDDITFGMMLKTWLGKKGFEVSSVSNIARARKHIESQTVDLVLSDLRLPDYEGIDLLKWMNDRGINIPLIIMTGYADIQSAVLAMKLGARDYIAKPVNPEELLKKISEALQTESSPAVPHSTARNSSNPKKGGSNSQDTSETNHSYLEGESDAAKQLYNYVGLVAPTNMSVLINGSSGTGKEYVAHRIHQLSKRSDKPFIAVDCGSIPKELAASEFFGHVKGSFTGALTDKTGAFVAANGGTIFLDEIGNLSYEVQIQLLRALQERKIRPVGSTQEISVDIRLVSATNENLEQAIEKGTFREDLYHRINEFTLRMPDLKERKEDILLFANFFLDQANKELDKHLVGFDAKASQALLSYHWPGNLRQMKNIVKRATLLGQGSFITLLELGTELLEAPVSTGTSMALRNEETEKEHILEALRQTGNNKSKAAQLLDIDRKTLYNKLKLYNIDL
ncbi:sigma-54-dependent transcriptional regulator [Bacteroides acidifaciens]|uniref:Sigma-54-dependent Fis family transcriptional regulator n=1 Tax=Bacteroides acidifaciens TaxID=85831 RepID=A0A7K3MDK0_9BACE|nr:sigma-54 dependent transcriptional regulator [Bacteroides acidifaciens]MBF0731228.1 sigma-54-dependent Fis family transcriptional regulator [Bacteroides acidifaciens]MBF0837798.1 sigma-54-dependent Fis family transcriptional regulator [Bacteroides acidifaciens]NDO52483.1 sigma-54-dependent Fis family transcriptional regulator [Bacteroides acidifaciens]TFU45968.1 sigma-54-dependent Fis family transcriptional regulator [Bacteroides acidifaciens]